MEIQNFSDMLSNLWENALWLSRIYQFQVRFVFTELLCTTNKNRCVRHVQKKFPESGFLKKLKTEYIGENWHFYKKFVNFCIYQIIKHKSWKTRINILKTASIYFSVCFSSISFTKCNERLCVFVCYCLLEKQT